MRLYIFLLVVINTTALNLDYLDPIKLQTVVPTSVQQETATAIIKKYLNNVNVEVDTTLFKDHKDVFALRTENGSLVIRASSGVAAVWGFNYYLKKYCKSQIAWQVRYVNIPQQLPEVDELVVANDRLRYYQNVCTVSYSFVWWDVDQWIEHVEWMALNGINMPLAPVAQESAWKRIYEQIGMTEEEINNYFTGPAFLSWLRMGNVHGWGGPLPPSWHKLQKEIQDRVINLMYKLGMIPVFPAFNGHVPEAFERIYPQSKFYSVQKWNRFNSDYCCGLFLDPSDPLFKTIGQMFWREVTNGFPLSHVYSSDPLNEVNIQPWSTAFVVDAAKAIYKVLTEVDSEAVWLVQGWMFVHNPELWPMNRVEAFLTSIPNGRMLILDLQSEQWPLYDLYDMYYGQPFIWSMLHNFGGTLGMFGNMQPISKDVYEVRNRTNNMVGIGLTPEGINQNYVVYDLMLESAWRETPISDMDAWVSEYAERRYGCNSTSAAWRHLLKSVYNFRGLKRMRGKYVVNTKPSFRLRPWAWYSSRELFTAFQKMVLIEKELCNSDGYYHDLVDVARQALQYRAEQLFVNLLVNRNSNTWTFNTSISLFLDVMKDMEAILATNEDFTIQKWLLNALKIAENEEEVYIYQLNARNQITLWGPNGEISDYANKQWAELFHYYYIPRWTMFLSAALSAKVKREPFDEKSVQNIILDQVEKKFVNTRITKLPSQDVRQLAVRLFEKWGVMPGLQDLPQLVIESNNASVTTTFDDDTETDPTGEPAVIQLFSTTPA